MSTILKSQQSIKTSNSTEYLHLLTSLVPYLWRKHYSPTLLHQIHHPKTLCNPIQYNNNFKI